jgi:nucleotide-binding universal stress UspA family protein
MAIRHILVTSDLSPAALRPCSPVAEMARALNACVTLLHVIEDSPPARLSANVEPVDVPEELQARMILARTQLELQADAFAGIKLSVEVVSGIEIVSSVLEYAEANHVDMIAMSTHGHSGFRRLVVGSLAEALIRRTTIPVVIFPRAAPDASRGR